MRRISVVTRVLQRRILLHFRGGFFRRQVTDSYTASSSTPRQPGISGRTPANEWGAPRLSDIGIVTLEITAETKTPADSDVQIDQVGFEPAPKCYSSVGGCHSSINKSGATATDQSQAKIGVLHHGKCLVAASHGKEIRTAKEHG